MFAAIQAGNDGVSGGPVDVRLNDPDDPDMDQLWEEVRGVVEDDRSWMVPFLELFGIVDGNGLSHFATSINTPGELSAMIEQFFKNLK